MSYRGRYVLKFGGVMSGGVLSWGRYDRHSEVTVPEAFISFSDLNSELN